MINQWQTCRLCADTKYGRPLFRYGIRHYCHAECGLEKWGAIFLGKIPRYEVGQIPYKALEPYPFVLKLAEEMTNKEAIA
jgi:hypothetical protein